MPDYEERTPMPGAEQAKPSPIEIDVPPGFHPPEPSEIKDGVVTLTCDWKVRPGGKRMCLVKLGDMDIPEGEDKEREPNNVDIGREIAGAVTAQRNGQY